MEQTKDVYNTEAEKAVLGSLFFNWDCAADVVRRLKPEDFYNLQNQLIFASMVRLFQEGGVKADILTVSEDLTKAQKLEEAGGVEYIAELTDAVPTAANVVRYVDIVVSCANKRVLVRLAADITANCFGGSKTYQEITEDIQKRVFALIDSTQLAQILTMHDIVCQTIELVDAMYKGGVLGVPSGLNGLDELTNGFQKGEITIIGARPSMGKTALALTMMQHIAIENAVPCGFFSLEMSATQIGQRFFSQIALIPSSKLRGGTLKVNEFKKLQDAAEICNTAPLYVVDMPNIKLLDLRALARRMVSNYGVQIIFIDYIGLITSENPTAPVYEQQSAISKSLKSLARELEIPLVVLCQVGRNAEGMEPNLAQLRGSGSIEQDADAVMFIHGERAKNDDGNYDPVQDRKLIVAKQRNGPVGNVDVVFLSKCTKFEDKLKG